MVRIAARFCGPPDSANGGYSAGILAASLSNGAERCGAVEVTLRQPPPLERELLVQIIDGRGRLLNGEGLVAEARTAPIDFEPPPPPSFEEACELSKAYIGHQRHHFPRCFVCGPARGEGDGLRIFPGAQLSGDAVAAPWVPSPSLSSSGPVVPIEVVWAALDCSGYFAAAAPDYPVALLGRMTAEVVNDVRVGEPCVVTGVALSRQGRKLLAGTAIYGSDGTLRGRSLQTWILLQPPG